MLGWARVAILIAIIALASACTSLPPRPSPSTVAPQSPAATQTTTHSTSPSASSPSASASSPFPESVLGLPVLTVGEASRMLINGELDGRVAAVGGYWAWNVVACPAPDWMVELDEPCEFVTLTDEVLQPVEPPFNLSIFSQRVGQLVPIVVPDSSGADGFFSLPRATPVVIVGHSADARMWQCDAERREFCSQRFVVDSLAWVEDRDIASVDVSNVAMDAVGAGEILLSATATDAAGVHTIDPRIGVPVGTRTWLLRLASPAASDGSAAGLIRVVEAESGAILGELPMAVAPDFLPGRLLYAASTNPADPDGQVWHAAVADGKQLSAGPIGSPSSPIVVSSGAAIVSASVGTGNWLDCSIEVDVAPLSDTFLTVEFPPRGGPCRWSVEDAPG